MASNAFWILLHGTTVSCPLHRKSAGSCNFGVAVAPAIVAIAMM